jgi:hypothetical protein
VLVPQTDDEGSWADGDIFSVSFESAHDEVESKGPKRTKKKVGKKSEIHVPAQYELRMVDRREHIECTGNSPQAGENWYFGGGIFITVRAT